MVERKISFDEATLEGKIVEDEHFLIAKDAVIASEIVHQYADGWAYKCAEELEKATPSFSDRWVTILSHPSTTLIQKENDIYGYVANPHFVKDLNEPKTNRPCRRGIRADIYWFKNRVPQAVQDKIKSGELKDVSIGFTYDEDRTVGEFNGQKYDYVQRNIRGDHLAAPVEAGRCPSNMCGIGVDSLIKEFKPKSRYVEDCPLCKKLDEMGPEDFTKALIVNIGKDIVFSAVGLDITPKEGGHKSKPSEYANVPDNEFADPENWKYPVDAEHVMAAYAYWSKPENQSAGGYSDEEWQLMGDRIRVAMKKHGHSVSSDVGDTIEKNREALSEARIVLSNIFT